MLCGVHLLRNELSFLATLMVNIPTCTQQAFQRIIERHHQVVIKARHSSCDTCSIFSLASRKSWHTTLTPKLGEDAGEQLHKQQKPF
jgi:hypothetical protein